MDRLDEVIAKQDIEAVLFRYARGVDRRDWSAVQACFYDDATDTHGDFAGSPVEFIEWVSNRHSKVPFSMHFLGNCLIEFLSDEKAIVETYFVAIQRRESMSNGSADMPLGTDMEVFGRYCDTFEKRHDDWRIAARQVVYDATRTQPSSSHLRKLTGVIGRRDSLDPVYQLLRGEQE